MGEAGWPPDPGPILSVPRYTRCQHPPVAYRSGDRLRVVRGIHDYHIPFVADEPDVVVHRPDPAVKAQGAVRSPTLP